MNHDIFEPSAIAETLQAVSDDDLMDEVARRMLANPDFYEKTCDHKPMIEAVDEAHRRMTKAAA